MLTSITQAIGKGEKVQPGMTVQEKIGAKKRLASTCQDSCRIKCAQRIEVN